MPTGDDRLATRVDDDHQKVVAGREVDNRCQPSRSRHPSLCNITLRPRGPRTSLSRPRAIPRILWMQEGSVHRVNAIVPPITPPVAFEHCLEHNCGFERLRKSECIRGQRARARAAIQTDPPWDWHSAAARYLLQRLRHAFANRLGSRASCSLRPPMAELLWVQKRFRYSLPKSMEHNDLM
jgi:hypothetical protein